MESFIYKGAPTRVIFGSGTASRLGGEMELLSVRRALFLSTPAQTADAEAIAATIGDRSVGLYANATMHTPVDVTDDAMKMVVDRDADVVVAIGGGSTIGLSKAIALRTDLPQIVLPTSYAGSEMTAIIGQTEGGKKTTQTTPRVQPEVVIYDVDLSLSLPPAMAGTSGINAIAHAVEALYAQDRNPVISLMAEEAVRSLAGALPRIVEDSAAADPRREALYGAWLCGMCLGSTGAALHHKICHVLGGSFAMPHAETHTVMLPHVTAYNAPAAPEAMARLSRALQSPDPARALFDLAGTVGAARSLRELGLSLEEAVEAARLTFENAYWNPRPLDAAALEDMMRRAWAGDPPQP